jgi:adenine/guanine phosphoribosyltransferase-like PRPP-binding protein
MRLWWPALPLGRRAPSNPAPRKAARSRTYVAPANPQETASTPAVLSRSEHSKRVRGAYATRGSVRVDKLCILLIDDVLTTGATLAACARAWARAGSAAKGLEPLRKKKPAARNTHL